MDCISVHFLVWYLIWSHKTLALGELGKGCRRFLWIISFNYMWIYNDLKMDSLIFFKKDDFPSLSGPAPVRSVNSLNMSPSSHIISVKWFSLVRSFCVEYHDNQRRLCKFIDAGFDRSFVGMKGKSMFRVSVYSSDNISPSFLYRMAKCNLSPGSHLIISGNDAVLEA